MVTNTRQKYREELRRTILDAAREAFVARGYENVSMRELAERIGCTHGALYGHFRDKREIFDAIVEESFEQLTAALRGLKVRGNDPVQLARKAARAYVEFGLTNPHAYEFAFVLRRPQDSPRPEPHAAYGMMRALVKRCIDEKRFAKMNVDVASQSLWSAVHGITTLLIARPDFPWVQREAVIRRVIDSAIDGLLRRARE
jgi:AcrR family transcriptional regulator